MNLVMAKDGYRKVGDKWLIAKKCTKCGKWLAVSTENYYRLKHGRYGLKAECKECQSKYHKQYHKNNKNKITKYSKQWYEANRDEYLERCKQYYQANRYKYLDYHKQYRQSPQGQVVAFNKNQRRRTKEEQQGTGITKDQWLEMMQYFDWKCAYSGKRLTDKTRSVDHIIPLNSGGDNMIWNCVPMTRSLNSSKQDKDMLEWYREQDFYDPKRLEKIYEWQEFAYNKWGKDTQYFNTNDIQIKLL